MIESSIPSLHIDARPADSIPDPNTDANFIQVVINNINPIPTELWIDVNY